MKPTEIASRVKGTLACVVRKPRHFWFVHFYPDSEDGWRGPHRTIDAALAAGVERWGDAGEFYIAQGRRLTKREREDMSVEYTHEVDCPNALRVELPNTKAEGRR